MPSNTLIRKPQTSINCTTQLQVRSPNVQVQGIATSWFLKNRRKQQKRQLCKTRKSANYVQWEEKNESTVMLIPKDDIALKRTSASFITYHQTGTIASLMQIIVCC